MTNLDLVKTLTNNVCIANDVDPNDLQACLELAKKYNSIDTAAVPVTPKVEFHKFADPKDSIKRFTMCYISEEGKIGFMDRAVTLSILKVSDVKDEPLLREIYKTILHALRDSHYWKSTEYTKEFDCQGLNLLISSRPVMVKASDASVDVTIEGRTGNDTLFRYNIISLEARENFDAALKSMFPQQ